MDQQTGKLLLKNNIKHQQMRKINQDAPNYRNISISMLKIMPQPESPGLPNRSNSHNGSFLVNRSLHPRYDKLPSSFKQQQNHSINRQCSNSTMSILSRQKTNKVINPTLKLGELIRQMSKNTILNDDKERVFFPKTFRQISQDRTNYLKKQDFIDKNKSNGFISRNINEQGLSLGFKTSRNFQANNKYFGTLPEMSDKLLKTKTVFLQDNMNKNHQAIVQTQFNQNDVQSMLNVSLASQNFKEFFQIDQKMKYIRKLPKIQYKRKAMSSTRDEKLLDKENKNLLMKVITQKIEFKQKQSNLDNPKYILQQD
eukprot:403351155